MKTRFPFLIAILFVSAAGLLTQAYYPAPEATLKSFKYSSEDGKVQIKFPCDYNVEATEKELGDNVEVSCENDDLAFYLSFLIHNTDLSEVGSYELAQTSADAFVETTGGTIRTQQPFMVKDKKGEEMVIDLEGVGKTIVYRVLIVDQIQYQMVIITGDLEKDQGAINKFLKSFKLRK
jgi:hypothetical protein